MANSEKILSRIRKAIEARRCCPVVGAGVSIAANAPTWREYLKQMAEGLPIRKDAFEKDDFMEFVDAATYLQRERIRAGLAPIRVMIDGDTRAHRALAAWECSIYSTTNFDDGLERAVGRYGTYDLCFNDKLESFDLFSFGRPKIVKLCSSSSDCNSGASTRLEFASLLENEKSALELLITLLRTQTVVFVGCSLRDPLISRALDHVSAVSIGKNRHVAILPDDVPAEYVAVLEILGVDTLTFQSTDKTKHLAEVLELCKRSSTGQKHIVVFEPGTATKTRQMLQAIDSSSLDIGRVAVVTEVAAVADVALNLASASDRCLKIDVVGVKNVADASSIVSALAARTTSWNAIVAPYEFAILSAAKFALAWSDAHWNMQFHSAEAARISRDKREFRRVLSAYHGWKHLVPVSCRVIGLDVEMTCESLLEQIVGAARELKTCRVVVKPPDAAGSIGVRPIDIRDLDRARASVDELINIVQSMPVTDETARCEISELIVDCRIESEEFSVESRSVGGAIEPLAVHWKVDIDADQDRFFERLFVTLPRNLPICGRLIEANAELLGHIGVAAGVFHAEFRGDPDTGEINPLEVGLRPGGGMVSSSVAASRGVDLFQAALECALKSTKSESTSDRIVATGLVFAKRPGILPPLGIRVGKEVHYLNHDDPASPAEWLRQYLETVARQDAKVALDGIVTRPNSLSREVAAAFNVDADDGRGLRVKLRKVDLWERPGSIVNEEEACYVAGLLIVADPSTSALEAVAESIAAMQLCLQTFICEPQPMLSAVRWRSTRVQTYPLWWKKLSTGDFRSDIDSWTLAHAIEQHGGRGVSILDLGCGSARPAIKAIKVSGKYHGIDIDPGCVRDARGNLAKEIQDNSRWCVEVADISDDNWLHSLCECNWDLLTANLPYLPAPDGLFTGREAREVDGGLRGLRFVPRIIQIADRLNPKAIVVNTSSLCDLAEFAKRVGDAGYLVNRVVVTVAELEEYAKKVRPYLDTQSFPKIYGKDNNERQLIYGLELRKKDGIPFELMIERAETIVRPDFNAIGTMAVGVASW
jgi:biotin carboxylase/SAM-dependent methyltransferase